MPPAPQPGQQPELRHRPSPQPQEGVDLDILVGGEKQQTNPRVVLSNSFGFGGHNSAILFSKL